jgi:hypothetical protein
VSKVTLRPDGEVFPQAEQGGEIVGGETRWEVLADESDDTYVKCASAKTWEFTLEDPSFPTGAVVKETAANVSISGIGPPADPMWSGPRVFAVTGVSEEQRLYDKAISVGAGNLPSNVGMGRYALSPTQIALSLFTDATLYVAANGCRVRGLEFDVVYVEKPTLEVTAPSGTVETTNRPTVTWSSELDPDGGGQTSYEVKVFTKSAAEAEGFEPEAATPAGEASGTGPATSAQLAAILADGEYRAYVRISQTVMGESHHSDWAYADFTIEVVLPALPGLTLAAEDDSARVKLAIAQGAEGDATTEGFEAQWSHDGESWTDLRTEDGGGLAEGTSATLYDYEAPNGVEVGYRVRAWHEYEGGARAWSDWTEGTAAWESADRWLKHPTDPTLNMKIEPYSYPGSARTGRMANLQPLGRKDPIVVSDTRIARAGSLVLWVESEDDQDALDALLDTLDPLLLQMAAQDARKDRWVAFGTVEEAPIVDKLAVVDSLVTLEWTESVRP